MNITSFRAANLNDVAALVQLVNTAYQPEPGIGSWTDESGFFHGARTSEQALKNLLLADDSVVLLGLHEDAIIACVHLEKSKDHAQIGMLAVNPYLTHTINIHLKTICYVIKNLRVALHLEK